MSRDAAMGLVFAAVALFGIGGCSEPPPVAARDLPQLPAPPEPPHPATPEGVELGRRLFFDRRLSGDDRISCATCHDPERAFTDGVARSTVGASGRALARNAPTLTNVAWAPALFWDGGSKNLESLTFGPITHPDEMNQDVAALVDELSSDAEMRAGFDAAFPGEGVTPSALMRALAQYMRSLVSSDSRYDRWARGEPGAGLSASEVRGFGVYRASCARCHATALFTDNAFHNQGLDPAGALPAEDPGRGRARVSFDAADERAFRTPTLRNLSYTAPYMHDGRFATLGEVIGHYRGGVRASASLDAGLIQADGSPGIPLTDDESRDLLSFLATLDDPAFVGRHRAASRPVP